ncbi:rhomboid-like protein [Streptomyces sp. NPDC051994]|uniref:rhomboid-like protein n=1 Tax=unclassified Streptomyces TaxID=2593676 RepID=UPI00343F245E
MRRFLPGRRHTGARAPGTQAPAPQPADTPAPPTCPPPPPPHPTPRASALHRTLHHALHHTLRYIRSAPGTYLWLAALFVTTVAMHHMSPEFETEFLRQRSTNIHELSTNPLRVLIASAFWIDGGGWLPYAVLYTVFHAQAERWLGTLRWLIIAFGTHVAATFISEGALLWAIRHDYAPQSAVNTLDVGVSYALAGVVAVLTYRIAPPYRHLYLLGVLVVYGAPLLGGRTFTDVGHFASVLIGLACYPLTRGQGGAPWNPADTLRAAARRLSRPRRAAR